MVSVIGGGNLGENHQPTDNYPTYTIFWHELNQFYRWKAVVWTQQLQATVAPYDTMLWFLNLISILCAREGGGGLFINIKTP